MRRDLSYRKIVELAVAEGATSPDPGEEGVMAWSTTLGGPVVWMDGMWTSLCVVRNPVVYDGLLCSLDSDSSGFFGVERYGDDNAAGQIRSYKARGTRSSPSAALNGDTVLAIQCRAWHSGGAWSGNIGSFQITLIESPTPTAQGTRAEVSTVTPGTTTRGSRVYTDSDGHRPASNNTAALGDDLTRWMAVYTYNLHVAGSTFFTGIISPSQLTAHTHNWAPTGIGSASQIRFSVSNRWWITGLSLNTGQRITLTNVGSVPAILIHESTSSGASNRFACPQGTHVTVYPGASVEVWNDPTTGRNRIINASPAALSDPANVFEEVHDLMGFTGAEWTVTAGVTFVSTTAGKPGGVTIDTTSNAAVSYGLLRSQTVTTVSQQMVVGGGELVFEALVDIGQLWTGANTGQMRLGFMDEISGAPTNAIHAQYDNLSANWQFYFRNAGTNTSLTGGTAVTVGVHLVRIVINAAGTSAEMFVDGVSQGSANTNIPTAGFTYGAEVQKTAGTNSASMKVDMMRVRQAFTTPRY